LPLVGELAHDLAPHLDQPGEMLVAIEADDDLNAQHLMAVRRQEALHPMLGTR